MQQIHGQYQILPGTLPVDVGGQTDPGTTTLATGSFLLQKDQLALSGSERLTLEGTTQVYISGFGDYNALVLGTPRVMTSNFKVLDGYFFDVLQRMTLRANVRATLTGSATVILTDDFGPRRRIVLSG